MITRYLYALGFLIILSLSYFELYKFFGIETSVENNIYSVAEEDEKLPQILNDPPMNFSASEKVAGPEPYNAFWLIGTEKYHYTDYYEALYVYAGQRRVDNNN